MRWRILGALALLVAVAALSLWQVSRARCFALTGPVTCRVQTREPLVALTFDDGPTPMGVDAILPALEDHGATATFFLVGADMARRPELAPRLVAAGQEIANHSYSHRRMVGRSAAFYDSEIGRTEALLQAAGGTAPLFRPPYGKKLFGLPVAVRRHGLRMVLWDVEDPPASSPQAFARQVVSEARPGSIILLHAMHPANGTARQALPLILDGLQAKGLRAVSVGALLARADGPARHRRLPSGGPPA